VSEADERPLSPDGDGDALSAAFAVAADWPEKAVDAIDHAIATVNDLAIRRIVLAGRAVIFGLIILAMATVVTVVLSVSLVRLLDVYAFGGRTWASYLLLGGLMSGGGAFAFAHAVRPAGEG
jgi:hypothetical protein